VAFGKGLAEAHHRLTKSNALPASQRQQVPPPAFENNHSGHKYQDIRNAKNEYSHPTLPDDHLNR
jgi:hypothetical protein